MPRGAPDWIESASDYLLGYNDIVGKDLTFVVAAGSTSTIIDILGVGTFGTVIFKADNSNLRLMIALDGVQAFRVDAAMVKAYYGLGNNLQFPVFGCGRYDDVNNIYSLWVDFDFKLVFFSSLKIQLQNPLGAPITAIFLRYHYKSRL